MARPARVRIRSRKPCTRARRRLLGWKVRLPLATAHSPCCVLRRSRPAHRRTVVPVAGDALGKSRCVLLVTGAVSGQRPVAAVSPTFGRLFEGTDAGCPGQTSLPHPRRGRPIDTIGNTCHGSYRLGFNPLKQAPTNGGRSRKNLLASCINAVSNRNGFRPRTEDETAASTSGPAQRLSRASDAASPGRRARLGVPHLIHICG